MCVSFVSLTLTLTLTHLCFSLVPVTRVHTYDCSPQVFSRSTKGYVYALSGTPELWSHVVPNRTQIVQVRSLSQDGIVRWSRYRVAVS